MDDEELINKYNQEDPNSLSIEEIQRRLVNVFTCENYPCSPKQAIYLIENIMKVVRRKVPLLFDPEAELVIKYNMDVD